MATTLKVLCQTAVPAALTTVYTAPSVNTIVKEIIFCNTSINPVSITLYYVANAGTAGVSNTIVTNLTLMPNESQFFGLSSFLTNGFTIQAIASTAGVIGMTISGVEM